MARLPRVGVRELRQNLSVYLRRVGKGRTFEVTDRGVPVALLTPLAEKQDPLDRLEVEGVLVRRARGHVRALGPPLELEGDVTITDALEEQRGERL